MYKTICKDFTRILKKNRKSPYEFRVRQSLIVQSKHRPALYKLQVLFRLYIKGNFLRY